jgi:hypothetical protein
LETFFVEIFPAARGGATLAFDLFVLEVALVGHGAPGWVGLCFNDT